MATTLPPCLNCGEPAMLSCPECKAKGRTLEGAKEVFCGPECFMLEYSAHEKRCHMITPPVMTEKVELHARSEEDDEQIEDMTTTNTHLQRQLDIWNTALTGIQAHPYGSTIRKTAILNFCKTFVPPDVSQDDILYFAAGLTDDALHLDLMQLEISQCASGLRVEEISGDGTDEVVFILAPSEESLKASELEGGIYREVVFISHDEGLTVWTAQG